MTNSPNVKGCIFLALVPNHPCGSHACTIGLWIGAILSGKLEAQRNGHCVQDQTARRRWSPGSSCSNLVPDLWCCAKGWYLSQNLSVSLPGSLPQVGLVFTQAPEALALLLCAPVSSHYKMRNRNLQELEENINEMFIRAQVLGSYWVPPVV